MASLRDTRRRIGSVKNTRQITKAMKMVAGAKLRRAQDRAVQARPYAEALRTVLARVVAAAGDGVSHPLLTAPTEVKKVLVVVMSSDRGLCGAFNGNLLRKSEAFAEELAAKGLEVQVRTYGKKSAAHFRSRRFPVQDSVIDLHATKYVGMSQDLAGHLTAQFQAGEVHEVWLASNRFKSVINQEPTFIKVLPLSVEAGEDAASATEYKYEPSGQQILDTLLPLQLQTTLLQALLENEAGEHAARMAAMDAATRNASELIDSLTLEYNRARQAAITKELIEIVSGASAL